MMQWFEQQQVACYICAQAALGWPWSLIGERTLGTGSQRVQATRRSDPERSDHQVLVLGSSSTATD